MLDRQITQDDFSLVYMATRGKQEEIYPKIAIWSLDSPIAYDTMQVSVTVLQRQMTVDSDWEFVATLLPSDPSTSIDADEPFVSDRFAESGEVTLPVEWSFEDAVGAVSEALGDLIARYA